MLPTRPTILIMVAACLAAGSVAAAEKDVPTALVLIDIQEFYFPGGALPLVAPEAASANAGRLLARFRAAGLPVFHVGHAAAAGRDFHADVQPAAGEPVLIKNEVNAFQDTDLRQRLQQGGIRRAVLCGMQTHMCLEGAVRAAHDYGFEVVVVGDACATRDLEHGGAVVPAAQVQASTLATLDRVYARVIDTETALAEF